jgi:RNA polymerase sigma factor (sigma-70 family)
MSAPGVPRAMSRILEVYKGNKTALKQYLRRFVARAEDVEDIAQEAFLRAFAAESIREIQSPKAFLFKVAKNVALNERARQSYMSTVPLEDFGETNVLYDNSQITAEDQVEGREHLHLFARAVAELPPQCARVFLMRKVDGLTCKEIALRLEISESTVEKHAALGLLRCSRYMRANGYVPNLRPSKSKRTGANSNPPFSPGKY